MLRLTPSTNSTTTTLTSPEPANSIIVTDDSSLVPYEIDEDGNFVEVDAKYVEDYAIAHTNKKVDGFVFTTKTLGNYVLSTEELGQEEQPADETPVSL